MYQKLANHNQDIQCLIEKGYAVSFDSGYLIIRDIPYLDSNLKLQISSIITKLIFTDEEHIIQQDHQIYFSGSTPFGLNNKPIPNLGDRPQKLPLSDTCKDIIIQRAFSNKPKKTGKFKDFFEKIESYVSIISGPAIELHGANPYTFRAIEISPSDTVFNFCDTLTSRAGITDLTAKLKDDVVAIIGLGGTGAYVLDFLVNTPVQEIRSFDLDHFHIHNSYRSPGKLSPGELGKTKIEVYESRYNNFRKGLIFKQIFIDSTSSDELKNVTFAFVCIDKGSSRKEIFDLLIDKKIPFIDVGMGLNRKRDSLSGLLRTTYYSVENSKQMLDSNLAALTDNPEDLYKTNIQIGELNALNACLAVIKFKKLREFYFEENPYYNSLFDISDSKIVQESNLNEN